MSAALLGSTSVFQGAGSEGRRIVGLWWLMFAMGAAVYVVVAGLVLTAVVRGRRRARPAADSPTADDRFIWIGGLAVPVVILAVLAVVTVTTTSNLRPVRAGELAIEVTGRRWWWDIRYPDQGIRTANELHVPVGRPLDLVLTSADVVHSFWVPALAGKVDMVTGQVNHLRVTVDRPGTYRGECAEFCGLEHARMQMLVIADPPDVFERWMARVRSGAGTTPEDEMAARGALVFQREPCGGCHTVEGTPAKGTRGPELTYFGGRRTIAAATIPNDPKELAAWIRDPQDVKRGAEMPPNGMSAEDLDALVAYLESMR